MAETWSGGCQCGAIRYRFSEKPSEVSLCHCRMCQKWTGGFYSALAGGPVETFVVTRGEISIFKSSDLTERGFCAACGTPLTFHHVGATDISVSIGSLDRPEEFPPTEQLGADAGMPYVRSLGELPDVPPIELVRPDIALLIRQSNHQHPDHDTDVWPPEQGFSA